jgi:hypothetical protein
VIIPRPFRGGGRGRGREKEEGREKKREVKGRRVKGDIILEFSNSRTLEILIYKTPDEIVNR